MITKIKGFFLDNQNQKQTIIKNLFWLSAGQVGSRLFRGILIIYAARALGASEYGVFSYVLGLAGFFTIFADNGVNAILTREAAKKPEEANYYFSTIFWIKIVLLAATAILVLAVAPFFSKIEGAAAILPFIALLTIFDGLREFCAAFFRAKQKMELDALINSTTNIAITIIGFVILYFFASAKSLAIAYTLSASAGTILGIIILRDKFGKIFSDFKKSLVSVVIKSAWPVAVISLMGVFLLNLDIVMLGFFKTSTEVGLYAAGQKIIQLLYVLPSLVTSALFPVMSHLIGENKNEKLTKLLQRGVLSNLVLAVPITVGAITLGNGLINFLYGNGYAEASLSFKILSLTLLAYFPGIIINGYVFAQDQLKKVPFYTLIGSMTNFFLNLLLIPKYGIEGAAIATVCAQFIFTALSWRLAKKINNFTTFPHLKKIFLASVIMGAGSVAFGWFGIHVLINILLSTIVYFSALYLLKEKVIMEVGSLIKPKEAQQI